MKAAIEAGSVVMSKKGRDKDRVFVVLYTVDADFVMLTDGDSRKMDHLKKKKRMHLASQPVCLQNIIDLYNQKRLKDSDVRTALAPFRSTAAAARVPQQNREG